MVLRKKKDIKIFQKFFKEKVAVNNCLRIYGFSHWLENRDGPWEKEQREVVSFGGVNKEQE